MRIGLPGGGATVDKIIRQAERAEADGFASLWYASAVAGDPLVAMALAGRATSRIELGTAVLQTYACHPVLQATRAAAVVAAIGAPGRFTLGVGPSHQPVVEGMLGTPYDRPGRHTEEYVAVLAPLLRGEQVSVTGEDFRVQAGPPALVDGVEIPVLVSALAPRLLRVAGQQTAGTILWMGNARAVEQHVAPASARPRPTPAGPSLGSWPACRSRCTTMSPRRVPWPPGSSRRTAPCPTTSASWPTVGWPGRRRRRSWGTSPASPPRSRRCSTRARPTCGRRRSPSATIAPRSGAHPCRPEGAGQRLTGAALSGASSSVPAQAGVDAFVALVVARGRRVEVVPAPSVTRVGMWSLASTDSSHVSSTGAPRPARQKETSAKAAGTRTPESFPSVWLVMNADFSARTM